MAEPGAFQRLVVRMVSFHIICAYIAAIGKRFRDAGLDDILVESGIVGSGSVAGVLEGRHYNWAVLTHKVIVHKLGSYCRTAIRKIYINACITTPIKT